MNKINTFLSKTKKLDFIFFLIILFFLYVIYEYPQTLQLGPESLHNWRQADCASIARMYYDNGMHFFEPKIYNVLNGEGNCAGELPILYYFIACLYKIFGPYDLVYRAVNLTIFFLGIFSLYSLTKRIIKDRFFAFVIPLLFFSSPLIMLFADGFLTDTTSLSMTFIAWNFIIRYREDKKQKYFWWSMLFFALAGLLKVNSVISFVALGAIFFIEINGWQRDVNNIVFIHKRNNIIGFIVVLSLIVGWYWWAIQYNTANNSIFMCTKPWPGWSIWDTTDHDFLKTINGFFADSVYIYFQPTYALIIFLTFFINANRNNIDSFFYNIFLLILIGVTLFIFYFFMGIKDNIYYCINLLILPVFIFIVASSIIKNRFPKTFNSIVFRLIIVLFVIVNINYAQSTLTDFYHNGKLHFRVNDNFSKPEFRKFIDSIGINKTDKVISYPDGTPNVTLYYIGRQGWTDYNIPRMDTTGINNVINIGAKYLIISMPKILAEPAMQNFTGNYVANFGNIYVYKLGKGQRNTKNGNIRIKNMNNQFIYFDETANRKTLFCKDSILSQQLYLIYLGNGNVALQSSGGKFACCDVNYDKSVYINTDWLAGWETFRLIKQSENTFALKAYNGKYVSVNEKEGNILKADADAIGKNETFIFTK